MTKVQRYKVGYYTDEWGMSSNTPCLVPDDSGYAVKFEDYFKLEAENERLKHNLATTEQTMREYQELAAKRLEEIAKYRDAPVVAHSTTNEEGDLAMLFFDEQEARKYSGDDEPIKLIVKPGEEK